HSGVTSEILRATELMTCVAGSDKPENADHPPLEGFMKARLGIAPIAWWNDDLKELSDDVSLEECLRQASEAGFTGMETGRRFPMDAAVLGPILARYGIKVCGGWFSGRLLDGDIEE